MVSPSTSSIAPVSAPAPAPLNRFSGCCLCCAPSGVCRAPSGVCRAPSGVRRAPSGGPRRAPRPAALLRGCSGGSSAAPRPARRRPAPAALGPWYALCPASADAARPRAGARCWPRARSGAAPAARARPAEACLIHPEAIDVPRPHRNRRAPTDLPRRRGAPSHAPPRRHRDRRRPQPRGRRGDRRTTSESLLRLLFGVLADPVLHARFSWRPGSLAIWDNRLVQHRAIHDYGDQRRVLYRATLA
ncbi:TauD/TfdA family dioxygenase [Sorangium sp. So ce321]|uniref:TauD/TfdA dioxygenase family protein n=1 Tax=Sorangium sp. So ce321 TaxID=3133300 RepID=UPI003F621614